MKTFNGAFNLIAFGSSDPRVRDDLPIALIILASSTLLGIFFVIASFRTIAVANQLRNAAKK